MSEQWKMTKEQAGKDTKETVPMSVFDASNNYGLEPQQTVCACEGYATPHEYGADECVNYWAEPRRSPQMPLDWEGD